MSTRIIVYGLLILLAAIQYPLWLGKGGWLHVYEMDKLVKTQEEKNRQLELRNNKLAGDVQDLKDGTRAIEERARIEHGMVKENEILIQVLKDGVEKPSAKNSKEAPAAEAVATDKASEKSAAKKPEKITH